MTDKESEIFSRLVKSRSLPHPTARSFDRRPWEEAIAAIKTPSSRDYHLCAAAIHFGHEIGSLRRTYEAGLFKGIDKRTGILLSIAMANYNFSILTKLAHENTRKEIRKKDGPLSIGSLANQPIPGPYPGNKSTSDSSIATIVDTIPHCIERALRLPDKEGELKNYWTLGSRLFAILSIEHCLRDLWQSVLWEKWSLTRDTILRISPTNEDLATLWSAWNWRQEMILIQGSLQDSMEERMVGGSKGLVPPFLNPTVIGIGGHSKSERRFRFGSLSGRQRGQVWHATENAILEDSYLAPFVDAPLPHLEGDISCRDLQLAWCVLRDCATLLASRCKEKGISDIDSIERYALQIRRDEIERAISHCVGMSLEKARAVVSFFVCDINNTSELFAKGLWASPLILIDSDENVLITLAAVSVGSTIRRIESWLDRGGLSDRLATATRGIRYEAWVREELANRISNNQLLRNARCSKTGVVRRNDKEEQIDLLVQLGGTLIVGEVKCFLAPVEPMERFNYLSKLEDAGCQAVRKAAWVAANPEAVADCLGISPEDAARLRPIPIIVLNQGAGLSLFAGGARVVDFHFLSLYLKDGEYHAGTAFNFAEKRGAAHYHGLYEDEREAEDNFEEVMANPPTLKRFLTSAVWEATRFPMSNGEDLEIAICNFHDRSNKEAKDLISSVSF